MSAYLTGFSPFYRRVYGGAAGGSMTTNARKPGDVDMVWIDEMPSIGEIIAASTPIRDMLCGVRRGPEQRQLQSAAVKLLISLGEPRRGKTAAVAKCRP